MLHLEIFLIEVSRLGQFCAGFAQAMETIAQTGKPLRLFCVAKGRGRGEGEHSAFCAENCAHARDIRPW
jgi:hypothetical protein